MEKVESSIEKSFCSQSDRELGFDEIARERAIAQLNRCNPLNSLTDEENELLMFFLSQNILS